MQVFLTAPSSTEAVQAVLGIVRGLNAACALLSDVAPGGQFASLNEVDLLIAVLPQKREMAHSSAIFTEIGIALGKGWPVLLLRREGALAGPGLLGVPSLPMPLELGVGGPAASDLTLSLDLFLRGVRRGLAEPERTRLTEADRRGELVPLDLAYARQSLEKLRLAAPPVQGLDFERFVASLLEAAGAQVGGIGPRSGTLEAGSGVDLAFTVPGEEQRLGVVVVQVKVRPEIGAARWRTAQQHLQAYVLSSGAGLGMLIFNDATANKRPRPTVPLVLTMGIDEMLDGLSERSLAETVIQARNRAVHAL